MAADSGMDTCPSPEIADSRKRPLDGETENGDIKRSHFSSEYPAETPWQNPLSGDATYNFKTLVPAAAAGAIIGKGGDAIGQVQKETGAKVKMSKSQDFYPGTSERVCLITGTVDAIMQVMDFFMDKIREKPDLSKSFSPDADPKVSQDRDKQVKILVPNSTAGMIIGKAGNYIKQIKETTGSYVQISQKAKDISLQERCITVIGEKESNKRACMMILAKVVDDPSSGMCLNVSYADVVGPVANFNPTGSPYAQGQQAHLRASGYSEAGVSEICTALGLLAKHGVLGLGLPPLPSLPSLPSLQAAALPYFPALQPDQSSQPSVFGPIGQVSLGNTSPTTRNSLERFSAADVAYEQAFRQPAVAPVSLNNNSFGLATGGGPAGLMPLSKSPTPGDLGAKDTKNVEIAEVIVGAILGPGGRNLIEIQQLSGASIQISKKGTFAPGTRNRIVTISGVPAAISNAHYYIQQRIAEEEMKRARHNNLSGIMQ